MPDTLILPAADTDLEAVLAVERAAFGSEIEAELTAALLADPTAQPLISLLAWNGERPVGHVLFTAATVIGTDGTTATIIGPDGTATGIRAQLLAPLAVVPDLQHSGIGGALTRDALRRAAADGIDLVFVLGHPDYYPRHGFEPAGHLGLHAPYPIPRQNASAWMVQSLRAGARQDGTPRDGLLGTVSGTVRPARTFMQPALWQE